MTFYGVRSRFFDRKKDSEAVLLGPVHATVKPETKTKATKDYDEYVDYYHTLEDALYAVSYVNGG